MRTLATLLVAAATMPGSLSARAEDGTPVRLHAAGSLKAALSDVAQAFTAAHGIKVAATFGASGLLRERLEKGEAEGGVFASADLENPLALERAGKAGPVVLFARNRFCALARPGLLTTPETLLDTMLDPAVKVGTSTPQADPAGDYAWEVFRKADARRPGSAEQLGAKALKLVGGPNSPSPPEGVSAYAWHLGEGRADLFLTYCTNARAATREIPGAHAVDLPPDLTIGAECGLTLLKGADLSNAATLALFILSPEGQTILARHGFEAPLMRRGTP
jgi:molybdate transport system substrate-binding protein